MSLPPSLLHHTESQLWALALGENQITWDSTVPYLLHELHSIYEIAALTQLNLQLSQKIAAILELHRRLCSHEQRDKPILNSPQAAFRYLHSLAYHDQEVVRVLYLDNQLRLITDKIIAIGSLNAAQVQLRELLRPALLANAYTFILAHNHPSGNVAPSEEDFEFTKYIITASATFGVPLQDHLIISHNGFISLRQKHPDVFI